MYIPSYYKITDKEWIDKHLSQNPFGIITSVNKGKVEATHLPFLFKQNGERLKLISHMSRANDQWKHFQNNETLTIFQGPDTYISPTNYEKRENVPTWNYTAVHVRGEARLLEEDQVSMELIEETIDRFEPQYKAQWSELSSQYISGMMKGLVFFEVIATSIEAKFKLSQNKTNIEKNNIIESLGRSDERRAQGVSEVMKDFYKGKL
jgi:transcriptional regulator